MLLKTSNGDQQDLGSGVKALVITLAWTPKFNPQKTRKDGKRTTELASDPLMHTVAHTHSQNVSRTYPDNNSNNN